MFIINEEFNSSYISIQFLNNMRKINNECAKCKAPDSYIDVHLRLILNKSMANDLGLSLTFTNVFLDHFKYVGQITYVKKITYNKFNIFCKYIFNYLFMYSIFHKMNFNLSTNGDEVIYDPILVINKGIPEFDSSYLYNESNIFKTKALEI